MYDLDALLAEEEAANTPQGGGNADLDVLLNEMEQEGRGSAVTETVEAAPAPLEVEQNIGAPSLDYPVGSPASEEAGRSGGLGDSLMGAGLSLGGGVGQGLLDTASILRVNSPVVDKALGFDSITTPQVPRVTPKGESIVNDMMYTTGEWLAPIPFTKINKVVDPIIAGSAALGQQMLGDAGETISGLTAAVISALRGRTPKPDQDVVNAQEYLRKHAFDADAMESNITEALNRGEKGDIAALSQDQGMYNVQSATSKGSKLQSDIDALAIARSDQMMDDIGSQLYDGTKVSNRPMEDVATAASERVGRLDKAIKARQTRAVDKGTEDALLDEIPVRDELLKREQELNQAAQSVDTPLPVSDASKLVYDELSDAKKIYKTDVVDPLYEKFDAGAKVSGESFVNTVKKWGDENLNPTTAKLINQKYGQIIGLVNSLNKKVAPAEAQAIISEIKTVVNNALKPSGVGASTANKFVSDMGNALEKTLIDTPAGKSYKEATEAFAAGKKLFDPTRIAKAAKNQEPQTFFDSLIDTGSGGAVVGDQILGTKSPEVISAFKEGLRAKFKEAGADVEGLLTKHDELLDRFPDLKQQFTNLVEKQKLADEAAKKVSALPEVTAAKTKEAVKTAGEKADRLSKSVAATQVGKLKANPTKFLDDTLKNISATDLTKLSKQMDSVQGGKDALKGAIKDCVLKKIKRNAKGDLEVPEAAVDDFNIMKRNLIDSGILSKDEVINIERTLAKAKKSTTLKKAAAMQKAEVADKLLKELASTGLSVAALKVLPTGKTNQLMVASSIKKLIASKLESRKFNENMITALEGMIKDPQKFLDGARQEGVKTAEDLERYIGRVGRTYSQSVADDEDE